MNFSLSEEQSAFKQMVNKYLTDHYDFQKRRDVANSDQPYDKAFWSEAAEMGWLTLPFSAEKVVLNAARLTLFCFLKSSGALWC